MLQTVNQGGHELLGLNKDPRQKNPPVMNGLDEMNKNWQALCLQLNNAEYKLKEVQEHMRKYYTATRVVVTWFKQIESRLRSQTSFGIEPKSIKKQMAEQQVRW